MSRVTEIHLSINSNCKIPDNIPEQLRNLKKGGLLTFLHSFCVVAITYILGMGRGLYGLADLRCQFIIYKYLHISIYFSPNLFTLL